MGNVPAMSLPAVSLVAAPGKRAAALDIAREADELGFAGIAAPSLGAALALCGSLAHVTRRIPFWTSIESIYLHHATQAARTASHIAEVSGGRFRIGLGVSHAPVNRRLGLSTGAPLADVRAYVAALRASGGDSLPPVYLAAMRDRMLTLAAEVADGAIWANACLSAVPAQLARVPAAARDDFFRAVMVPTVIDDDREAARAVNRRTLAGAYLVLPAYRGYWRDAGYAEEMDAVERALAAGDRDAVASLLPDRWLDDCTASGPASTVRDQLGAWADLGVLPIAVMSSPRGGQLVAIRELFTAYAAA
jgi:alkanesulfonate monooxygenase SsuD/methylene tetrahydromethanopterin reductase-like flavin-dependent oxidoreductase (luciferase family)